MKKPKAVRAKGVRKRATFAQTKELEFEEVYSPGAIETLSKKFAIKGETNLNDFRYLLWAAHHLYAQKWKDRPFMERLRETLKHIRRFQNVLKNSKISFKKLSHEAIGYVLPRSVAHSAELFAQNRIICASKQLVAPSKFGSLNFDDVETFFETLSRNCDDALQEINARRSGKYLNPEISKLIGDKPRSHRPTDDTLRLCVKNARRFWTENLMRKFSRDYAKMTDTGATGFCLAILKPLDP